MSATAQLQPPAAVTSRRLWSDDYGLFESEAELVRAAIALGASDVSPWSGAEIALANEAAGEAPSARRLGALRDRIRDGFDPLGDAFCALRSPARRRDNGATYTPPAIVRSMLEWAAGRGRPGRVVDPGAGSGRFLLRAGREFPRAELVGVETDPLATLLARANLAAAGLARRSRVILRDYRRFDEPSAERTLYIGNPPYVRHHGIAPEWKRWLSEEAAALGLRASQLAGLYVHFFLATARRARPGDFGAFVTAAEWLEVNYGALVRSLLLGPLGGLGVTIVEPTAQPFPDAATTAAIATFEVGARPASVMFRRVGGLRDLNGLESGRRVSRDRLTAEARWSRLSKPAKPLPAGYVELGELCRVHRGQVTGANGVWIAGPHSAGLPESALYRAVTRAREVIEAGAVLTDASRLRSVIDLPADLQALDAPARAAVERFLSYARQHGADRGYIARHRKPWWSVGLRAPAPIVATYMARRPPAFALNEAEVRHINIAHGVYPRDPMPREVLANLVRYLRENVSQGAGRTYAGGLTKFEPKEMERLIVPGPELLAAGAAW